MIVSKQTQEQTELLNRQFSLIKGQFSPEEAKDILNHLLTKKINFHQQRNFSTEIRFGESNLDASVRINELKECRNAINELLTEAEKSGKKVKINSDITLEIA